MYSYSSDTGCVHKLSDMKLLLYSRRYLHLYGMPTGGELAATMPAHSMSGFQVLPFCISDYTFNLIVQDNCLG